MAPILIPRRIVPIIAFLSALLLSAPAAPARSLHAVAFDGVVRSVEPTRVILKTADKSVQVPPGLSSFTADGKPVEYGNLQPGQSVHVSLQPSDARLSSIDEGLLTLETARGSIVLPAAFFPTADLEAIPAFLQLADHRYVAVTLSTALAMETRGEGFAMANLPSGAVIEPLTVDATPDPFPEAPLMNLPETHFKATVRRVQRTSAELETADHLIVALPSKLASYDLDGVGILFESLAPGQKVRVAVRPFSGVPVKLDPLLLTLLTASGKVCIPVKALPLPYRLHTMVPIRQTDGRIVEQALPH